jgi:hypothetical protein
MKACEEALPFSFGAGEAEVVVALKKMLLTDSHAKKNNNILSNAIYTYIGNRRILRIGWKILTKRQYE